MFIDPFIELYYYQLRSIQGIFQNKNGFKQLVTYDVMGDLLAEAYDRKYHSLDLSQERKARIWEYHRQGYSQMAIAGFEAISQQRVSKIIEEIEKEIENE